MAESETKPILQEKMNIQEKDPGETSTEKENNKSTNSVISSNGMEQNRGCFNHWSPGAIAILFTLLGIVGLMTYSLGIPISNVGQKRIEGGTFSLIIVASVIPCLSYIFIVIFIKLGTKCNLTSEDTCHIRWNIGHWRLVTIAGFINLLAMGIKLYAGNPYRTPPHLQAIFFACTLPASILWRYLLIKKCEYL